MNKIILFLIQLLHWIFLIVAIVSVPLVLIYEPFYISFPICAWIVHLGFSRKLDCPWTRVEKANIDRSGAVAQGLYAINCYMGMQWGENQPEDHVRYARNDLDRKSVV